MEKEKKILRKHSADDDGYLCAPPRPRRLPPPADASSPPAEMPDRSNIAGPNGEHIPSAGTHSRGQETHTALARAGPRRPRGRRRFHEDELNRRLPAVAEAQINEVADTVADADADADADAAADAISLPPSPQLPRSSGASDEARLERTSRQKN